MYPTILSEKGQGRCTSGDLSVSGLSPFMCIYLGLLYCSVCCIVLLTLFVCCCFCCFLRARHDHNKIALCGMIKVF